MKKKYLYIYLNIFLIKFIIHKIRNKNLIRWVGVQIISHLTNTVPCFLVIIQIIIKFIHRGLQQLIIILLVYSILINFIHIGVKCFQNGPWDFKPQISESEAYLYHREGIIVVDYGLIYTHYKSLLYHSV